MYKFNVFKIIIKIYLKNPDKQQKYFCVRTVSLLCRLHVKINYRDNITPIYTYMQINICKYFSKFVPIWILYSNRCILNKNKFWKFHQEI